MSSRTPEQLRNHYEVEKALADRLRNSTREERSALYPVLYDELFKRVPDHPRLTRRDTEEESARAVRARLDLLDDLLTPQTVFFEVAPGDCRLACTVAGRVKQVYAADISDQSDGDTKPANFALVLYDGSHLDFPPNTADVAFSYQFIEHLHPDDVAEHFALVHRVLKPGGVYVFDTPHRYTGPHDISGLFSDTPEGFHLKEWTFTELREVALKAGFAQARPWRRKLAPLGAAADVLLLVMERVIGLMPHALRRRLGGRLMPGVTMRCVKSGHSSLDD